MVSFSQFIQHIDTTSGLGLRMVPKLKLEHISFTFFSRMRVDLAARVNSFIY